ncbi:hypothetical protein N7528_004334 [Penicillium herquei]|nr:hypothetical protein N7528_004334 [Penicillium herquei]
MTPFSRAPRFRRPLSRSRQTPAEDNHAEDSHAEASTPTEDPGRPANASLPEVFEGPLPPEQQRPQPLSYHINRALEDASLEPMTTRFNAHEHRGEVADGNGNLADLGVETTILENCPLCGADERLVPVFTTTLPAIGDVLDSIAQQNENEPLSFTAEEILTSLLALQTEFLELRRRYHSELQENRALLLQLRSIIGPDRVLTLNRHVDHFMPLRRYHIMKEFEEMVLGRAAMRAASEAQHQHQGRSSHDETATGNAGAGGSEARLELVTGAGRRLVRGDPRDPLREWVEKVVDEGTAGEDLESSMRKHERNSRGKP